MADRPVYVTDTHSLLWYLHNPKHLSPAAATAFGQVAANEADLIVPVIVIAEIIYVLQAGKVTVDFESVLTRLQASPNVAIAPLTLEHALALRTLTAVPEMHDRMVVAEAHLRNAALITRDQTITASSLVPVVW